MCLVVNIFDLINYSVDVVSSMIRAEAMEGQ